MTREPAPHYSYPRRSIHDPIDEAPYADVPFDWTETQGDLAPALRRVQSILFEVALVMAGWFAGGLMALATLRGWW